MANDSTQSEVVVRRETSIGRKRAGWGPSTQLRNHRLAAACERFIAAGAERAEVEQLSAARGV
jgi:hypothetical protein